MKTRKCVGAVFGAMVVVAGLTSLSGCGHDAAVGNEVERSEHAPAELPAPRRSAEAEAILEALIEDDRIAQIDLRPDVKPQDYLMYVVSSMKQIDISECPQEFQNAYELHIDAWQGVLRTTMDHASDFQTMDAWSRVAVLHGTQPRTDLEREFFAAFDEVHSTFEVCTDLARDHGIKQSEFDTK